MKYPRQIINALNWHIGELITGNRITFGKIQFWVIRDYKGAFLLYATLPSNHKEQSFRYGTQIGEIISTENGYRLDIFPSFK